MNHSRPMLQFLLAMLIFGTNGPLVQNLTLGSAEIVLFRTLLGSLFLLAVVLARRKFDFHALRADLVPATVGGAALGMNWVLLFMAFRSAGVSLSTLVYYCGPILVLALSPVLFREKLTWNKLTAMGAVAAGMVLISGQIVPGSDLASGLLCAGGAAVFYALLMIQNKRVRRLTGIHCAMYELIVAFFVVLLFLLCTGTAFPIVPARSDLLPLLILGIVNTGLAYCLYFSAMQRLPGQTVAVLSYMDPLSTLVFSAIFLKEVLLPLQMLGAVLILGGACLGELRLPSRRS